MDMGIAVHKSYFHVFYIPFFPTGPKSSKCWCRNCGSLIRIDSLQTEFEKKTKSPFYLYTGLILIGLLVLFMVNENFTNQKEKQQFVQDPKVGDIYLIQEETDKKTSYYFLKLSSLRNDTVTAFHGSYRYDRFVTRAQAEDLFDESEELVFTKKELAEMLKRDEIVSVER